MPKDIDLLLQADAFARRNGIGLNDPDFVTKFAVDVIPRLQKAAADEVLVYGLRTEHLFEAMILSLGGFRLFKREDSGTLHGEETFRAPDFRIVGRDGRQWLIEVKNVHKNDPFNQSDGMTPAYLASLRRYCDAVGVSLLVAHFWSRWGMWTLVEVEPFLTPKGGLKAGMLDAFPHSRLGDFGDVSISLPGDLRMVVREEYNGTSTRTVAVNIHRGDQILTDPRDRKMASILLYYGDWPLDEPDERDLGGGARLRYLRAAPVEESGNGFDHIGFASQIFSRFYRSETSAGDQVTRIRGEPRPEWFRPLADWDFTTSKLGFRLFRLTARSDDLTKQKPPA